MVSVVCLITLGDLIVFPRHHGVVKTDRYGHMIEVDDNKDYRLDQLIFEERKTEVSNRGTDIDKNIPVVFCDLVTSPGTSWRPVFVGCSFDCHR